MTKHRKKITFFSVYFTFFIDTLSWAIVFPIFAPYFLDPNNALFSTSLSPGTRTMILGFFLMAFSLGQFLGAPLMGEYADKHGRKKALAMAVFFTFAGLALSALSMQINNLSLLFISRLVTGVFASSTAICLSSISDLCESQKEKIKSFGYLSMSAGLAFVIGAFAGGKLSDQTINPSFTANLPIWLAAALTLINLLFILVGFKETAPTHPSVKFHFFAAFKHIAIALQTKKIKKLYSVYFLFLFSWTILLQFMPVLTVEKFLFTNSNLGDLALFMGVCWAIGSGYLSKFFAKFFQSNHILEGCLIGFTILCTLVVFAFHIYILLALLGLSVILGGIAWPICTNLISNMGSDSKQGKIMGMSQSIQSAAMAIGPLVGGFAFSSGASIPFLIAGSTSFISLVIYYFILKDQ